MKLYIRQRFFSWTDSYDVFSDSGAPRYTVRTDFLSLTRQIRVYDSASLNQAGCIRQKLFSVLPAYEIQIHGLPSGTVRRSFSLFRKNYLVDYLGWDVQGDIMGWNYRVTKNGREIISIARGMFKLTDTYVLSIHDPADEIPGLLLVLAIDAASHGSGT